MKKWVSLHDHTMYSLLDGCGRITDFVSYAKKCDFSELAITDHGTCAGFLDFQALCLEVGIKPIFGLECYIAPFEMTLKGITEEEDFNKEDRKKEIKSRSKNNHLILLAKDNEGLKSLYRIITAANMIGYYRRPRIDYDFLSKNSTGLICTTACLASRLNNFIMNNDEVGIDKEINFLKGLFKNDVYLELEANGMKEQKIINKKLIELSDKYGVKLIIANDVHYINKDYKKAHEALIKINSDSDWEFEAKDLYLMNYDEMFNHMKSNHDYISDEIITKALENTNEIANKCSAIIDTKSKKEPIYISPDNKDNHDYLSEIMIKGIYNRGIDKLPTNVNSCHETNTIKKFKINHPYISNMREHYLNRLKYEFQIIKDKGYIDYFLIVWDFINYAKENDVLIGPGRGSVGGSVLAWIIGLIELDPIEYKLSFERFLNPQRQKSPDIDTDIEDLKRDFIRKYLADKWGENCIAPIVAYSRYSANSLFRDLCKLHKLSFIEYNEIARDNIETGTQELKKLRSFKENLEENEVLRKYIEKLGIIGEQIVQLIAMMEGQIKNTSIAAAGTIISNQPLQELLPLRLAKDKTLVTEWEGMKLSASGFLKMDLLGLKTLTYIKQCLRKINKSVDWLYSLPMDDPAVYEYFAKEKTSAIFQFEGASITGVVRKIKPVCIEDLAICSALHRPGPMTNGVMQDYMDRRNGDQEITYIHPIAKDILADTLGVVIYQEQIIELFNKLGLDYGEADILRRTLDEGGNINKYYTKIKQLKVLPEYELDKLIEDIKERSGYSFNKSHAIQYAIISYWEMYLKVYHPLEFFLANINENFRTYGRELQGKIRLNIIMFEEELEKRIYYGDINDFTTTFELYKDTVSYGYACVKYLNEENLNNVVALRPFTSVQDFLKRGNKIKKNVAEILVGIGMLDNLKLFEKSEIKMNRSQLMKYTELYRTWCKKTQKQLKDHPIIKNNIDNMFTIEYLQHENILDIKENKSDIIRYELDLEFDKTLMTLLRSFKKQGVEKLIESYIQSQMNNPYKRRNKPIGDIFIAYVNEILTVKKKFKTGKNGAMCTLHLIDKDNLLHEGLMFNNTKDINESDVILVELEKSERKRKLVLGHINLKLYE